MKYFPKSIRNISMVIFIAMFFVIIPFVSAEETDNAAAVDSDNDGYANAQEIKAGYSPYNPSPVKLQEY